MTNLAGYLFTLDTTYIHISLAYVYYPKTRCPVPFTLSKLIIRQPAMGDIPVMLQRWQCRSSLDSAHFHIEAPSPD